MIYKLEEEDEDDDSFSFFDESQRLNMLTGGGENGMKMDLKLQHHLPVNRPVDVKVIVYIVKVSQVILRLTKRQFWRAGSG